MRKDGWTPEQRFAFRMMLTTYARMLGHELPSDERELKEFYRLYTVTLERYLSFEEAVWSLERFISGQGTLRRFPIPADLIKLVRGDPTERAEQVWREVISAMKQIGAYSSIRFRDPIVNAVIKDLGGWPELCRKSYIDLEKAVRWEFCKLYCNYWHSGKVPMIPYLPGLTELENRYLFEQGLMNGQEQVDVELVEYGTDLPPGVKITLVKPPKPERYLLSMDEAKESLERRYELPKEVREEISRIALEKMAYVTRSRGH